MSLRDTFADPRVRKIALYLRNQLTDDDRAAMSHAGYRHTSWNPDRTKSQYDVPAWWRPHPREMPRFEEEVDRAVSVEEMELSDAECRRIDAALAKLDWLPRLAIQLVVVEGKSLRDASEWRPKLGKGMGVSHVHVGRLVCQATTVLANTVWPAQESADS